MQALFALRGGIFRKDDKNFKRHCRRRAKALYLKTVKSNLTGKAVWVMHGVELKQIIEANGLKVIRGAKGYESRIVNTEEIIRPGLPLAGFFTHFDPERLQVFGRVEKTYLSELPLEERRNRLDTYFEWNVPAVIITRGMEPLPEMMEMAERYDRTLLGSDLETARLTSALIAYLSAQLAPSITRHGVLVEVYGEGVLILGDSGIGKSETAIELVKRGHRLISDDAVEIRKISNCQLVGTAPDLIRHYIELRGIGVVDVCRLFGMCAVKHDNAIDLVVKLEQWNESTIYNRLGLDEETVEILGVQIPALTIPVRPGRNLAIILEVAAMNNRNKKMGYNAAKELTQQINDHFEQVTKKKKKDGEASE